MAISIERLRVGLLAGAGLLVLVVAGFLGYAGLKARKFVHGLPGRLGVDVRQETNAFTYSQTVKGQTIFTIHASKAVQHKDNKVTLHDVGIVLYGSGGNRADRIYGDQFEYDQNAGVMRAVGEVQIDLATPAPADAKGKMDYAAGKEPEAGAGAKLNRGATKPDMGRVIHVKTRGLVFSQKEGSAETHEEIEFSTGGLTGHAKGAEYSSNTGILVLQSTVEAAGLQGGQPVVLTANHAELDRQNDLVTLTRARYVSLGAGSGGRTVEAERVKVHLRRDGTPESLEGDAGVRLKDAAGAEVDAAHGDVALNEDGRPRLATLRGGVTLVDEESLRQAHGGADEGTATFDSEGRLQEVVMHGAVHMEERVRPGVDVGWSERQIAGETVNLAMVAMPSRGGDNKPASGRVLLRQVTAIGAAQMMLLNATAASQKGSEAAGGSSAISGDVLTAYFEASHGQSELRTVAGNGHTMLRRVNAAGAEDVSYGEMVHAVFGGSGAGQQPIHGKRASVGAGGRSAARVEIVSAVQQGGVKIVHRSAAAAKTGIVSEEDASAKGASYEAASDTLTLEGAVQVSDAESVLWADKVVARRGSQEATATGGVRVSYLQSRAGVKVADKSGGDEPVHVVAARAELQKAAGTATFYGENGRKARLWQGASQVEAPEIVFDQNPRRVVAKGNDRAEVKDVRAAFVKGTTPPGKKASVFNVLSRTMTFLDEARRADFSGGVLVESSDGTMRGDNAQVFLSAVSSSCGGFSSESAKTPSLASDRQIPCREGGGGGVLPPGAKGKMPKGTKGSTTGDTLFGGSVDRVVATGGIVMEQPGRQASGEKVVYTGADGLFVLTGKPGAPPKVVDSARGTVTGDTLRLHAGDNSVVVLSDKNGQQRVDTDTQVKH